MPIRWNSITPSEGCCGMDEASGIDLGRRTLTNTRSCRILTTAAAQTERLSAALKRSGFIPMFTFTNDNTGNEVTLWARGRTVRKIVDSKASSGATSRSTTPSRRG